MARHSMGLARLTTTIITALLLSNLVACTASTSPDQLLLEAQQYRQKGDKKAAIIQLKNLLQQQPNHAQARLLLGRLYVESGDPVSAEKELRKAITLGASDVMPDLGKALLMQGQFDKVLAEIKQDARNPDQAEITILHANAQLGLANVASAKALFEQVLKKNPDLSDALLGLARIALAEQQLDVATRLIEHALAKNPDAIDCLRFNGDLLRMQGKNDAAHLAYSKILKLKPDNIQAHIDIANLSIQVGKLADAKTAIEAARKIAPNHLLVVYTHAMVDFREGKYKPAMESLQQVLRAVPDHMPSLLLMGTVQLALGSDQQAELYLRKFIDMSPGHVYANKILASIALKNNNPEAAITLLMPLLEKEQNDPGLLAMVGDAQMRTRHYSKAADYFQKASDLAPQSAKMHLAIGINRLGLGENARAIAELERAASLDTKNTEAGTLLVMTHLRNKDYDKALVAVNAMELQHGKNPLVANLKGGVFLARQELTNARASFQQALTLDAGYLPALDNLTQLDLLDKKPEQARQRYEAALAKDKKNAGLMTALAQLASAQGNGAEAIRWLERAASDNPDSLPSALLLADAYQRSGAKEKALTLAQKIQAAHPSHAGALGLLAEIQFGNGKYNQALENYRKLTTLKPDSAALQMRIARVQVAQNDLDGALDSARNALALQADALEAQALAVALLIKKSSFPEALAMAKTVQQQRPSSPVGLMFEGDTFAAQNKLPEALQAYERGFKISKDGKLLLKIHQSLMQAGKLQEADARLVQWLQEHPTDLAIRLYFAGTKLSSKQYKLAMQEYEKIILQDPKNVIALNDMAWSCQQEKDSRALSFAERAFALDPGNPAVLDTLGWILLEHGDTTRAVSLLQKASALAPLAPEIRYHLGMGLVKAGDRHGARKQFEQLLAENKNFAKRDEIETMLAKP
jgi:putative PEP-CTERM system TPR-repeat lipoprotein